jgi:hypothetical protein
MAEEDNVKLAKDIKQGLERLEKTFNSSQFQEELEKTFNSSQFREELENTKRICETLIIQEREQKSEREKVLTGQRKAALAPLSDVETSEEKQETLSPQKSERKKVVTGQRKAALAPLSKAETPTQQGGGMIDFMKKGPHIVKPKVKTVKPGVLNLQ